MERLTRRQKEVLDFIIEHFENRGYAPSVRDIARKLNMKGPKGAFKHLFKLEEKGYIRRQPDTARAIEVVGYSPSQASPIPVVGKIAAGTPILAVENIEGTIPLAKSIARWEGTFLLCVKGNSMIEDHIQDGDYVLVRPQPVVENGDIVVTMIEDEATVKRFYQEGDLITLRPANPRMEPITVRKGEATVRIVGKVMAVLRLLDKKGSFV